MCPAVNSSIAWLDFADADRRRMMEVVSLFKDQETRDELGVGSIRDIFAEMLFPGTGTLQTRARYFLFTPWLYRSYEQRRIASQDVANRLRSDEVRIISALKADGETDGVIGQVSRANLHRFPSSIYWNGLRRWGILRFPGSQEQYHRGLNALYLRAGEELSRDEHEGIDPGRLGTWDASLPPAPREFPNKVSFALSQREAAYLHERLLVSCTDSLLAHLVDRCRPVDDVALPWLHPEAATFPKSLQAWLMHARNFSEAMHGPALLYNLMLAELSRNEELASSYRDWLAEWRQDLVVRWPALKTWDRVAFWNLLAAQGLVPARTQSFVDDWLDLLLTGPGAPDVAASQEARRMVRERELYLKRGRSRFESPRHLEIWSGAAGTGQLNYRWPVARRIANDIIRGLGRV